MPPAPPRHAISLNTAAAPSGPSASTWQRRVEHGQVPQLRRPGTSQQTLVRADVGAAAAQDDADAVHWLGTLHAAQLAGRRGPAAESLALMWMARAAAHGHVIAQQQVNALKQQLPAPAPGA